MPQRIWGDRVLNDPSTYLSITLLLLLVVWLLFVGFMIGNFVCTWLQ